MKYLKVTDRNNLFKRDKFCKNSNLSIFNLSSFPICLPPFLTLPFSIPHQKHSQQQSPTITLSNILSSHITTSNIRNGISTMPTCSLHSEASYLAFININSTILISLDDYTISNHAELQQWELYHPFLFHSTLSILPFIAFIRLLYQPNDFSTDIIGWNQIKDLAMT